jgi:hypothetical protein
MPDLSTPLYTIVVAGSGGTVFTSGSTSTTSSIGSSVPLIVNGYSLDNTPLTGSPILIGAKAVNLSTYTASYTSSNIGSLSIDKNNGALLVSQGNLTPAVDGVVVYGSDNATWRPISVISASVTKSVVSQVLLVQPVDDHGQIGSNVGGFTLYTSSSFLRPAAPNTASYVSGDIIANSPSAATTNVIPNVVRVVGGSGTILNATLVDGANQPTIGNYEVYLFKKNRTSENDNSLFSCSYSDAQTLVGVIPFVQSSSFVMCSGSAGTTLYTNPNVLLSFVCLPLTSSLFWNLVVRNSYVPISSEQYTLNLNISAD